VQLEDKLVDGREAAHAESQQREDVLEHGEEALPAPMVEAVRDAGLERRGQLLGAIRMILDRQSLTVSQLRLPQREARALEALQVARTGKSRDLGSFVYASDRRDMLEQALAVLQPNLTRADDQTARELHAQFADLAARVGELRHQLTELEDSQDELLEGHAKAALEAGATEPGDKPKPTPSDPDAPRPATTLTGPELAEPPRPATTLVGPELAEPPAPPTTLIGPEIAERPRPATTLAGPDLPPEPVLATTLAGAELAPEPTPESSLGDATEIAAKARRPWWRRPFG
jgi:hypothetical protein